MKALLIPMLAVGLTACVKPAPPIKSVPCIVLEPRTDALRDGLLAHPETPDAVGNPATDIILGTNKVCK